MAKCAKAFLRNKNREFVECHGNIGRCIVPVMGVRSSAYTELNASASRIMDLLDWFRILSIFIAASGTAIPLVEPKGTSHVIAASVRIDPFLDAQICGIGQQRGTRWPNKTLRRFS